MRPLELIFVVAAFLALGARWLRPRNRQATSTALVMLGLLTVLHLLIDGPRWQMIPAYAMVVTAAWLFARDLRRLQHAKAGMSAEWPARPSTATRGIGGAAIGLATLIAVVLPGLFYPRVVFDRPNGQYPVGRVDVYWVDSTREESFTDTPGDKRGVLVSFWYPSNTPDGSKLRYHPDPRILAADIAANSLLSLPGVAYSNLTSARTSSLAAPPFNIREGRSPLVLFSHDFSGTRMQNTFEFEQLASYGYVVASIEHTHASVGTVLPDGTHVPSSTRELFRTEEGRIRLVDTFVKDAQFVLDQISRLPRKDASDLLAGHIQLDKVAYLGHLLGGTAAAEGALRDARIIAGISMSGLLEGPAWQRGLSKPFLVFRSAVVPPDEYTDEQIALAGVSRDSLTRRFAEQDRRLGLLLRNGGTEIRMDGAASMSFSDFPLWSPFFARRYKMAGPDDPADVHWAVTSLSLRFLNQYLKGNDKATSVLLPPDVKMRVIPHKARE